MKLLNELVVDKIEPMIDFYSNNFGFKIEQTDETEHPYSWCQMKNKENTIMFITHDKIIKEINSFPKKSNSTNLLLFEVDTSITEMYNRIIKSNANILVDIYKTHYGTYEFGLYDPEGNIIMIESNIK